MIIAEAEELYEIEVTEYRKKHASAVKKSLKIWNIIGAVLLIIGTVLIIVGVSLPKEIYSYGTYDSTGAIVLKCLGPIALIWGGIPLIIMNLFGRKALKDGPKNFTAQIKSLYLNYLKCSDMSDTDKEFYKQKLEDIRNSELVNAIRNAGLSASAAIMFTAIKK